MLKLYWNDLICRCPRLARVRPRDWGSSGGPGPAVCGQARVTSLGPQGPTLGVRVTAGDRDPPAGPGLLTRRDVGHGHGTVLVRQTRSISTEPQSVRRLRLGNLTQRRD